MRKKTINADMPIGKLTKVKDFLPPPAQLAMPEETTKITISLKKSSVEFFRHEAQRYHSKYQRMIRELLDRYAMQYAKN
ncbi:MAG: CopG family transcriptional regulator [Candidatus Omnitrophota bacterium]|nr:CopG family transcriptional regulator [Candidatus Omnitrophota bacterium]